MCYGLCNGNSHEETEMMATKTKRINQNDYMRICAVELLAARGDQRTPPERCWGLYRLEQDIQDDVTRMVDEMFNRSTYGCFTTEVELLTRQESRIAERTDIPHAEKIKLARELRNFRALKASVRELREQNASAPSFDSLMTTDGTEWAQKLGILLN
jgi:hypothetical protein